MPSLNNVVLMGIIVTEPELKYTPGGLPVCKFRMAVQRRFGSEGGKPKTDFIPVTAWRQNAEFVANNLAKKSAVIVVGSLQTDSYVNDKEQKINTWEIVAEDVRFGERKAEAAKAEPAPAPAAPAREESDESFEDPFQDE